MVLKLFKNSFKMYYNIVSYTIYTHSVRAAANLKLLLRIIHPSCNVNVNVLTCYSAAFIIKLMNSEIDQRSVTASSGSVHGAGSIH